MFDLTPIRGFASENLIERRWKMLKLKSYFCLFLILSSSVALSARLKSYCYVGENSKEIVGQNFEERMPLASVSKLFTSFLAISSGSIKRKVYTQFFITPVKAGVYDVHIKGGHEPYFSRQALHWLIAKLNEAGVYNIRNLTFDQNFKYYHDTDRRARLLLKFLNPQGTASKRKFVYLDPVSGKSVIDAPTPYLVAALLGQNSEILKFYEKSVKEALENGVQLPKKIFFKPEKISFVEANQFNPNPQMTKGYIASPELIHMLKMMNWNSNNHSANQVFQLSGGLSAFKHLFYDKLGLQEKDVLFVNGSGQNANIDGTGREYNEATCSTVVKTVKALKKGLENQNASLQDAVSVVGADIGSTVGGKTYANATTKLSVIAKTGTVGTNITLAGMISSKTGNYFFFYNVEINPAPSNSTNRSGWNSAEANRARSIISVKLTELVKKLGGPKPLAYKPQVFDLENFEESPEVEESALIAAEPSAQN